MGKANNKLEKAVKGAGLGALLGTALSGVVSTAVLGPVGTFCWISATAGGVTAAGAVVGAVANLVEEDEDKK